MKGILAFLFSVMPVIGMTGCSKNVSLLLLLAAVSCCYYFSRRFLSPILRSLEQLKTESEMAAFINKNIYGKLGINSLKQLLRYASLMRQQEKEAAGNT